ncbi:hypothetical protein [Aeoliella sp.]|uniref:hypothetical protein n=1 Tax=Aeoliella sp. TaxID=2795800 RepID=UPI003CCBFD6A
MALKLKCPCGERLVAPESAIGKRGKCSKCGRSFVIPDPKAAKSSSSHGQRAAKPKVSAKAKKEAEPDLPDLPDLGSGFPDLGSELPDLGGDLAAPGGLGSGGGLGSDIGDELDDFLNEEISNPFQSPTTTAKPAAAPSKASGSTRGQRSTLANGIKLVFWGTVVAFLASVTSSLGGNFVAELAVIGLGVQLIGNLLSTVGRVVCLGGPKNTGGRGLLIGAVICDLGSIALTVLTLVGAIPQEMLIVSALLGLATPILFILYLKAVATWIRQPSLAEDARTIIIAILVSIALLIGAIPAAFITPILSLVMILGFFGTLIYSFFKYLSLLQHTAEAVRP